MRAGGDEQALRLELRRNGLASDITYRTKFPWVRERLDELHAEVRTALGDRFDAVWDEGTEMTWEEAVAYAQRMRGERRRPNHGWDSLTPAELDVVRLVADGLTNPQIAQRLLVETSTIKSHVHHIFTKLAVTTRSELAAATVARRTG